MIWVQYWAANKRRWVKAAHDEEHAPPEYGWILLDEVRFLAGPFSAPLTSCRLPLHPRFADYPVITLPIVSVGGSEPRKKKRRKRCQKKG